MPPATHTRHSVMAQDAPPDKFVGQLSDRLEREIENDEHDLAEYGGDDPHDPQRHRYHNSSATPAARASFEREDHTVVNSFAEGHPTSHSDSGKEPPERVLVTWDGPNDPANPQNFSFWRKIFLTCIVTILTLDVTLASSAPSTATRAIAEEFRISNETATLVTSLFLVGYVFGPIVWSGLSEMFGRRIIFTFTILIYTLFTLGQALAHNTETLLVTRFLSGLFASAPLTNGGGLIADIWDVVGRGPAVAIFGASAFIGPIIGPIMGDFVVQSYLGWRWVFWLLMIASGFCLVLCVFFLPETFAPVLLQQKARRLRKEDPVAHANKIADLELQDWSVRGVLRRTVLRPFIMLVQEPILFLVTLYMALVYGLIYATFEVLPIIFVEVRNFTPQIAGLTFIGIGIGTTIAAIVYYIDGKKYPALAKKWRGHPPPEGRLPSAMLGGPMLVVGIFWLCWSGAYESVHWIVPELATVPFGMAIGLVFISFQAYIVETYLMYSASALAANSIIRSAVGAAFPLFTEQMFHNLGIQWAGTLLGCISLLLAPLPFVFYRHGWWVRTKSKFAPCLDLKIKEEIENEERLAVTTEKSKNVMA